ncbi:MAG: hypothetical protein JWO24_4011, partial [Rhodospirillales bacterium]|nr:hypothetical protein [Rhodospirillales bacterium]
MPTPDDGSHGIEDPSRDDSGAPMTTPEPDSPAPHPPRSATLTRIRIAGFKSFSEATNVEVLPGLT